ncbi:MAG: AI-2E family transporter [Oscillospiraceae bacterium]|nr:AI-2E family transporter [Oscillospiraceae bacterium]
MKRYRWDIKYLHWGVTAFLVIAACILFYLLVSHLNLVSAAFRTVGQILSPFIWGLVIAYLLFPLMGIYSRWIFTPLFSRLLKNNPKRDALMHGLVRGSSVTLCILTLLVLIAGLLSLVVPQVIASIERIVENGTNYIDRTGSWLQEKLYHLMGEESQDVAASFDNLSTSLLTLLGDKLLDLENLMKGTNLANSFDTLAKTLGSVGANVVGALKGVYNVLIGIIVSVYLLYSQESFAARAKKLIYCIFSLEAAEKILNGLRFTNDVFMGFLSGKILDSLIVGILCFISCSILRIPYALLVSVIVGITNIIPFFGPFIGAIPSTLFILTESPIKALIFVIFVIILQQFDGNILGPKILGNRVGINGFWVMFSIILGAGLFGFAGMLLGIPVFVVIYTGIGSLVRRKLARSGLPTDTAAYENLDHFDAESGKPVYIQPPEPAPGKKRQRRKYHISLKGKSEAARAVSEDSESNQENKDAKSDEPRS